MRSQNGKYLPLNVGFPGSSVGRESTCNARDSSLIPGMGRDRLPTAVGSPSGSAGRESSCSAGDLGLIPGLGRCPGEGKGYPFQYSGLENSPRDCIVHVVTKSQTRLSDFHFHLNV